MLAFMYTDTAAQITAAGPDRVSDDSPTDGKRQSSPAASPEARTENERVAPSVTEVANLAGARPRARRPRRLAGAPSWPPGCRPTCGTGRAPRSGTALSGAQHWQARRRRRGLLPEHCRRRAGGVLHRRRRGTRQMDGGGLYDPRALRNRHRRRACDASRGARTERRESPSLQPGRCVPVGSPGSISPSLRPSP